MENPASQRRIVIAAHKGRLRVMFAGCTIADSRAALALDEDGYPTIYYFPRGDVDFTTLRPTDHHSVCPYKGTASYFSIAAGGRVCDNAAWCYATPIAGVAAIAGHLAFYRARVDAIVEGEDEG